MRIIYDQPSSGISDDTEGHIERALKELGHKVAKHGNGDIYLFHKKYTPPPSFKGKKVCWYFDKIDFGNAGRERYIKEMLQYADLVFITDETWAIANPHPKLRILRQGIGDPTPGEYEDRNIDVAFVGGHYGERRNWALALEQRYGERFKIYRNQFNRDLNNLCASIPIFVAPLYPSDDYYWSNRVYLLVGSGAFLIHPFLKGLEEEWGDKLVYYKTEEEMYEKIDYYLIHPEEREANRKEAYEYCINNFTYKKRCEKLLQQITGIKE